MTGEPEVPETFWALRLSNGGTQYHLREEEGYRVRALLAALGTYGFIEAEDYAGSPLLLNAARIESMFLSSPATRAYDKPWNEFSQRLVRDAKVEPEKPWEAE